MKKPDVAARLHSRLQPAFSRATPESRLRDLPLDLIDTNPAQPRRNFDEDSIAELAQSIDRYGLLQPVLVKENGERYLLVAGERRLRAHRVLGRNSILAVSTSGNPDEIGLIENVQREGLHPLDEFDAYHRMIANHGWTQEQLGKTLSKSQATVAKFLALSKLAEPVREQARATSTTSVFMLYELTRLPPAEQLQLWGKSGAQATVRGVREAAAKRAPTEEGGRAPTLRIVASAAERLVRQLRTIDLSKLNPTSGSARKLGDALHDINQAAAAIPTLAEFPTRPMKRASRGLSPRRREGQ